MSVCTHEGPSTLCRSQAALIKVLEQQLAAALRENAELSETVEDLENQLERLEAESWFSKPTPKPAPEPTSESAPSQVSS